MPLKTRTFAILAGLGLATAGVLAISDIAAPGNSAPLLANGDTPRSRWQMPMFRRAESGWRPAGPRQQRGRPHHHEPMMPMMQATSELEFLSLMIPHHQEAIDTAERVLAHSDRPEMREFAQDIISVQSAEIDQMETWLDAWYPNQTTDVTYTPMMRDLSQLEGDALDQAFLTDMIRHHMGAVMMSRQLVNRGAVEHPAVRPFAQNIADTQRQEIWQMRNWLKDWYGDSVMPGPMHQPQ